MKPASTVLITGGGGTLGLALAREAAARHYRVALADLDESRGEAARAAIAETGAESFFVRCDVRSEAELRNAVQRVTRRWGNLDLMVNCAGVASAGLFETIPDEDWTWQLDINLMGSVRGSRAALSEMRRQGHGHIVNIAALNGLAPQPGMSGYNAAEAAIMAFSETLYAELQPLGVGVTLVCPAFFRSGLASTMRSPDPVSHARISRLLEQGDVEAAELARLILNAVEKGEFLVVPPGRARRVWRRKRLRPRRFLEDMLALARKHRR